MNRLLVTNIAWALLAAGAYYAGTFRSRPAAEKASSDRTVPVAVASAPVIPRGNDPNVDPTKRSTAGADDGDAADWVRSFRGRDGTISPERMNEAVQAALRDPDPVRSTLYFVQLIKELTPENAPAALQAVNENVGGGDSMRYLSLLAHAWGEKDGKGALAALESVRGRGSEWARSTALAGWAAADPQAALEWLQERNAQKGPNRDGRDDWALSRGMLNGLARRDIDGALKYLMTLNEDQQGNFVGVLVEQKLKEGVTAGSDWAMQLPSERMRTNALETVGRQFLRQDVDTEIQWAQGIAARPDAHEAVADVADELAGRDAPAAAAWVGKLPPGPSQNHAYEDVFERWTRSDPLAASQHLTQMNPGPARDNAIQAFSRTLARENPPDAIAWASVISDPNERIDVQIDIARRWNESAPNDAQTWIAANLPPEAQARVLAPRRD
jgi:hypothetical protein